jgi:MoaA/NifB/PqqE/SkfB family radical SAM enzyme
MPEYYELDPSANTFKTLSIQTTYQCQQTCANCYLGNMLNNDSIPDVDIVRFEQAIRQLPNRTDIRFIGAEPTMNNNLTKMIKIVRQSGHRPSLLTNGLKLRRNVYAKELKESGLNLLGLSMNGGTNSDLYQLFDNGKYAKSKMIALDNCFKYKMLPHINMIVDPSNVNEIPNLLEYIVKTALKNNIRFSPTRFPVMIRLKSIGKMGIYRDTYTYNINELQNIVKNLHGNNVTFYNTIDGHLEKRSMTYSFPTKAGIMLGKITDWSVDDDGCPDSGSTRRGILTDNYKVAPFFEYYIKKQGEL